MGNKFILILGIASLIFLVTIVGSHSLYHYRHSIKDQKTHAIALAKTVAKSIDLPMLAGEMDTVQDMLVTVGQLEHLRRVHLTDANGIIHYSSDPNRIDTPTGSEIIKESIKTMQEVERFEHRGDDFIFSLALPIHNEARCYPCHDPEQELLGVLRLGIDWVPIRAGLMRVMQKDIFVAVLFYIVILVLSFLFQRLYNNAQQAYMHLQQTQEQLIKTEKMAAIGQMAAAISHDLRNPLTGIKMAAYYLGSKINKEEQEVINILNDIELEIDYASNVVTNILTYSRPTELIYTSVDINQLIEDTMHFVHLQIKELNIELVKEYGKDIPEILVDSKQIKQVIVNLLSNAIQAMPKGGRLTINTALEEEGYVQIKIQDTGTGISSENIERIFTPFFTTKARGVGLGLSIVNNIIIKHGGNIDIQSESKVGTTFTVNIPARKSATGYRKVKP